MKVYYPGPAVTGQARTEPQLHRTWGRINVGENEIPDELAAPMLEGGLVSATPSKSAEPPTPMEPPADAVSALSLMPDERPRKRGKE